MPKGPRLHDFTTRVVGCGFILGYPENLLRLYQRVDMGEGLTVLLTRNPQNLHDYNAIEVSIQGQMLGHLPADIAEKLAPLMDRGEIWGAHIVQVWVDSNEVNAGLRIRVERYPDGP